MTAKKYISQLIGIDARIEREELVNNNDKIKQLRQLKKEVEDTVLSITDGRLSTLLLLRYELGCKWSYIATIVSTDGNFISESLVRGRMHKRALKELEKKLKVVTKRNISNTHI